MASMSALFGADSNRIMTFSHPLIRVRRNPIPPPRVCPNESVFGLSPHHAFEREVFWEEHALLRYLFALDQRFDEESALLKQFRNLRQTEMRFIEHHRIARISLCFRTVRAALIKIIYRIEINRSVRVVLIRRQYEGMEHRNNKPAVGSQHFPCLREKFIKLFHAPDTRNNHICEDEVH